MIFNNHIWRIWGQDPCRYPVCICQCGLRNKKMLFLQQQYRLCHIYKIQKKYIYVVCLSPCYVVGSTLSRIKEVHCGRATIWWSKNTLGQQYGAATIQQQTYNGATMSLGKNVFGKQYNISAQQFGQATIHLGNNKWGSLMVWQQ